MLIVGGGAHAHSNTFLSSSLPFPTTTRTHRHSLLRFVRCNENSNKAKQNHYLHTYTIIPYCLQSKKFM